MDALFDIAVQRGASDIHLVVGKPPLLRVNGDLQPIEGAKVLSAQHVEELVFSLTSEKEKQAFMDQFELDIAYQIPSGKRMRINVHRERRNVAMAARLIPSEIPTMQSLDLPPVAQELTRLPHGLVLVTGPTGSGKSTALAAMIDSINQSRPVNIITLEDPIEFIFEPKQGVVRQRQFGQDFISFSDALKHILRQDPDVVMVGEMRDMDTIATTLTIAETGHLVFATLHTYSASQTINRLVDAFPAHQQNQVRTQLALTLRGVISQQLLPKIGGGQVAAREILINTPAVANLIRENKAAQISNVLQTSANKGMTTFEQDLEHLVNNGIIDGEVAKQYVVGREKPDADGKGKKW